MDDYTGYNWTGEPLASKYPLYDVEEEDIKQGELHHVPFSSDEWTEPRYCPTLDGSYEMEDEKKEELPVDVGGYSNEAKERIEMDYLEHQRRCKYFCPLRGESQERWAKWARIWEPDERVSRSL